MGYNKSLRLGTFLSKCNPLLHIMIYDSRGVFVTNDVACYLYKLGKYNGAPVKTIVFNALNSKEHPIIRIYIGKNTDHGYTKTLKLGTVLSLMRDHNTVRVAYPGTITTAESMRSGLPSIPNIVDKEVQEIKLRYAKEGFVITL